MALAGLDSPAAAGVLLGGGCPERCRKSRPRPGRDDPVGDDVLGADEPRRVQPGGCLVLDPAILDLGEEDLNEDDVPEANDPPRTPKAVAVLWRLKSNTEVAPRHATPRHNTPRHATPCHASRRARTHDHIALTHRTRVLAPFFTDVSCSVSGLTYPAQEDMSGWALGITTLYIDDSTLIQEVYDLTKLRAGDHCVVGFFENTMS